MFLNNKDTVKLIEKIDRWYDGIYLWPIEIDQYHALLLYQFLHNHSVADWFDFLNHYLVPEETSDEIEWSKNWSDSSRWSWKKWWTESTQLPIWFRYRWWWSTLHSWHAQSSTDQLDQLLAVLVDQMNDTLIVSEGGNNRRVMGWPPR